MLSCNLLLIRPKLQVFSPAVDNQAPVDIVLGSVKLFGVHSFAKLTMRFACNLLDRFPEHIYAFNLVV